MKFRNGQREGKGLIGGIGATAGALLIGLALLPLVASTGVGEGLEGWGTDDEGGGSLPSTYRGHENSGFGMRVLDSRPSFYLQGPSGLIRDAVEGNEGDRYFEPVADSSGEPEQVRVVFCGEVHLSLDATIFQQPGVTAGLVVGTTFGDAHAAIVLQDRIVQQTVMPANSVFPVPFAALQNAGVLRHGFYFFTANAQGQRNLISVGTFPGLVEIHQREVQG